MVQTPYIGRGEASVPAGRPPDRRVIAAGTGWQINEVTCHAGPEDRPFEERHDWVSIAVVVAGSFQYHAEQGRTLLYPGAFLLGNAGACFACGHKHGRGDRCMAFQFEPEFFAEISAAIGGSSRFRFPADMIPAASEVMADAVMAESTGLRETTQSEELAIRLAERTIALMSGRHLEGGSPSARDEKRITAALRHIENRADQPLDLDAIAEAAVMSKYHFLRSFRRVVGTTPYQYLLGFRLRRAALALTTTAKPVTAVALENGFGDISTFNAHFRRAFGQSPTALRRASG
jgi:AraC family transcriptional regulator